MGRRILIDVTDEEFLKLTLAKGDMTWRESLARGLGVDVAPRTMGRVSGDALDRLHDKFRVNQEKRRMGRK